jgi:hypothetical protein
MRSLRSAIFLSVAAVVLAVAGHAMAQQGSRDYPIVGTWVLDLEESSFVEGGNYPPPRQQTEIYELLESEFMQLTLSRLTADGSSTTSKLMWPASGGVLRREQGTAPADEMLIETRIAPGDWFVTFMDAGTQYMTMHKVVSTDGQKMRQTLTTYVDGERREAVQVFDRE